MLSLIRFVMLMALLLSCGLTALCQDARSILRSSSEVYSGLRTYEVAGLDEMSFEKDGVKYRLNLNFRVARGETPDLPWTEQMTSFAWLEPVGPSVKYPNLNNIGFFYDFAKFAENVKSARILREETVKADGQNSTCYAIEVFHYPTSNNLQKEDPPPEAILIDKSSHLIRQLTYQEVKPGTNSEAGLHVSHVVNLSSYKLNLDPPAWLISANAEFAKASGNRRAAKVGTQAAEFKVHDLDGAELSLSSLRDKVVLLEFWDTWCAPCRAELQIIMKVQHDLGARDLVVVRITDERAEDVREFQSDTRLHFQTFVEGGDVLRQYKIYARPVLIVIDKKGMISSYDESLLTGAELIERIKQAGLDKRP